MEVNGGDKLSSLLLYGAWAEPCSQKLDLGAGTF